MDRQEAWDTVLLHRKTIDRVVKSYAKRLESSVGFGFEDLQQMAWEGALKAVMAFDPSRGDIKALIAVSVRNHLHRCVRDHLHQIGGDGHWQPNGERNTFKTWVTDPISIQDGTTPDVASPLWDEIGPIPVDGEPVSPVLEAALAQLTDLERKVIEAAYLNVPTAVTVEDLSQMTGLPKGTVFKAKKRALKKLKGVLG